MEPFTRIPQPLSGSLEANTLSFLINIFSASIRGVQPASLTNIPHGSVYLIYKFWISDSNVIKFWIDLHGIKISTLRGFPGGAVVENLPANAGGTGSSPGLGRSHMLRSNWAREPQLLSLHVWSLCSTTREAATVRGPRTTMKSGPRLPQLEKALAQKRRPNTAKIK